MQYDSAKMREFLEARLPGYLEMLRRMVGINSYTGNPTGVNALAMLTADEFGRLGFSARSAPSANPDFGDHLILTRPGHGSQRIGLISHLDTVFPPEEEVANDFCWREEGDRLYGPGSVDIKGGTVTIYMLLELIREANPELFDAVTWMIFLNSAEERISSDFGALCLRELGPQAVAALVFEGGNLHPSGWPVVVRRKGQAVGTVQTEGRGAHAGGSHPMGANAIIQLAVVMQQMAGLTDYGRELTFNVGRIAGGTVSNRVPHEATAWFEMRAFDPAVYADGIAALSALQGVGPVTSPADGFPCRTTITIENETAPWPRNPHTDRLLALWQSAGEELGMVVLPEERGGLSDGNLLWNVLPTLDGLGPTGAFAHCAEKAADGSKEQEYAVRSSFVPKTLLNALAVLELLAGE